MKAFGLVFPQLYHCREASGSLTLPKEISLNGSPLPAWLRNRLEQACRAAGLRLRQHALHSLRISIERNIFPHIKDDLLRRQSYQLILHPDGNIVVKCMSSVGRQYALITLCHLLEAKAGGAILGPLRIDDYPVYRVRGVMLDLAREYFPPPAHLRLIIDRLVALKINTLWLYLENNFVAPGLEDISPQGGMTPAEARNISEYGRERGIDVVPCTNLISHMEGWFRLERHADFCDGKMRGYPVLTDPRWRKMIRHYLVELAKAFPSPNLHIGLDELLFTGTNPVVADTIRRRTKTTYFREAAREVISFARSLGKTVWCWDDMFIGRNAGRAFPEGLEHPEKALAAIPPKTILAHWYYDAESDRHRQCLERLRSSGRPFTVSPSCWTQRFNYGSLGTAIPNLSYMARAGLKAGAFGYICCHWEAPWLESAWPLLAMSAGFAWAGTIHSVKRFFPALAFVTTGETDGSLGTYLGATNALEEFLEQKLGFANRHAMRSALIMEGPHRMWRRLTGAFSVQDREKIVSLLKTARTAYLKIGTRDIVLRKALRFPIILFETGLTILDSFDRAWDHYHRAALLQKTKPKEYRRHLAVSAKFVNRTANTVMHYRDFLQKLRSTGYTPYDLYVLSGHIRDLRQTMRLIKRCERGNIGLPYFEKLLCPPNRYQQSSLSQIRIQNVFHEPVPNAEWLKPGVRKTGRDNLDKTLRQSLPGNRSRPELRVSESRKGVGCYFAKLADN